MHVGAMFQLSRNRSSQVTFSRHVGSTHEVRYYQWVHSERTVLLETVDGSDNLIENLARKLDEMTEHHFVSKSQQRYLADLKAGLRKGHCVVLADFSENYSVVIQDEVQGYHWTKDQITVHPFVAYFVNESDNQQAKSFVCFSENLQHNTVAVFSFQKRVMESLKTIVPNLEKIYYFSDGAASQYKNRKNFSNLCQHDEDFGVAAEWHFFGTSRVAR